MLKKILSLALLFIIFQAPGYCAAAEEGERQAEDPNMETSGVIFQIALAQMAAKIEAPDGNYLRPVDGKSDLDILNSLFKYGFRPSPVVGIKFVLPQNPPADGSAGLIILGAYKAVGAQVFMFDLAATSGVIKLEANVIPAGQDTVLTTYGLNSSPKEKPIFDAGGTLRFDAATGLVTAVDTNSR